MICPALAIALLAASVWAEIYPVTLTPWSPLLEYHDGVTQSNDSVSWTPILVGNGRQLTNAYTGEQVAWVHYPGDEPPSPIDSISNRPSVRVRFNGGAVRFLGYWNDPANNATDQAELKLRFGGGQKNSTGTGRFGTEPVVLAETDLYYGGHAVELFVISGTVTLTSVEMMIQFPTALK